MRSRMSLNTLPKWPRKVLAVCGLLCLAATGCQTNIAGQTLPSPYFLRDDVQYFPAGEEYQLPNLTRALEQYRLEQEAIREGIAD
jgi:hypothetical protein